MAATNQAKKITDAGEKIGGARKDWRNRALGLDDLEAMTNDEAVALVRKDNVWPQPDWPAVVAAGMDPAAAALVKIMRDRMAQTPKFPRSDSDPAAVREGFVAVVSKARDLLMAARSVAEVRAVYGDWVEELGGRDFFRRGEPSARDAWFSVYKNRFCPFASDSADVSKAELAVRDGFPEKVPAWAKGLKTRADAEGKLVLYRDGRELGRGFSDVGAAMEFARTAYENAKVAAAPGKSEPKRPHLDRLERVGMPDGRDGADVSPDDFIETFGFRAVEFGNWLPDGERQQVLNLAYDALFDLADAIGWDHRALSLDGTLAVAFGARGSGPFAAHYEAGRKVINMTRLSGAGSLAHEYGHAVDDWAGNVGFDAASPKMRSGTGWYERPSSEPAHLRSLLNLPHEAAKAWAGMTYGLYTRERSRDEAAHYVGTELAKSEEELRRGRETLAAHLERPAERQNRKWIKEATAWVAERERRIAAQRGRLSAVTSGEPDAMLGLRSTLYAEEARKLCGKSGEYWIRPTEMFARAFEATVFDRLAERGARSDYLVHGVEEDRFVGPRYKGNPYPVGAERTAIREAVAGLMDEMRPLAELALESAPAYR
jgi:hypothetical protein